MGRQRSQQTSRKMSGSENRPSTGTLFIVGTPIGCPDDLSLRARTVLARASIVVAETPLATQTLLNHHGIAATLTGYGKGDEERIATLLDRLNAAHDIALVSDSGMPVIYDPGRLLITGARASGHAVIVIPGPSALTAAAALSGESADRLLFVGRLPRSGQPLDRFLKELRHEGATTVMFPSPSALRHLLERLERILPDRMVTLAVNMTQADERVHQGKAGTLLEQVPSFSHESQVTLVLSGARRRRR